MTEQLLPESPSRLVWMREYRSARRLAHAIGRGEDHDPHKIESLMSWLRAQIRAYVETCVCDGWDWSSDDDEDRAEMVRWITADLDLGELLGDERGHNLAAVLCQEAGWP